MRDIQSVLTILPRVSLTYAGMLRPRGLCGLEAKLFGLGLSLVVSGLGLVASGLGLIEVGLVASKFGFRWIDDLPDIAVREDLRQKIIGIVHYS